MPLSSTNPLRLLQHIPAEQFRVLTWRGWDETYSKVGDFPTLAQAQNEAFAARLRDADIQFSSVYNSKAELVYENGDTSLCT